jgi:hypothetical protein
MFELITFLLLQLASLNGSTTNAVGSSGWGSDVVKPTTNSQTTATNSTTTTTVGSSGWGSDKSGK